MSGRRVARLSRRRLLVGLLLAALMGAGLGLFHAPLWGGMVGTALLGLIVIPWVALSAEGNQ